VVEIVDVDRLLRSMPDCVPFDARPLEEFLEGHLPWAFPLDLEGLEKAALGGPEPDRQQLILALGQAPVRTGQPLVVYDATSLQRRDGYAAWLLAYAGLPGVEILDGGMTAWGRRRNLSFYAGYPRPRGVTSLREMELQPRLRLRVDPASIADGPPDGSVLVQVLPADPAGPEPGDGQVRTDELFDDALLFLYPYHLRRLLESRKIEPDARLLLQGDRNEAGLVWAALVGNGFDAALVLTPGDETETESSR
jgi:thiosulfate/3-mercaptopyruvate sulfurtransferase